MPSISRVRSFLQYATTNNNFSIEPRLLFSNFTVWNPLPTFGLSKQGSLFVCTLPCISLFSCALSDHVCWCLRGVCVWEKPGHRRWPFLTLRTIRIEFRADFIRKNWAWPSHDFRHLIVLVFSRIVLYVDRVTGSSSFNWSVMTFGLIYFAYIGCIKILCEI